MKPLLTDFPSGRAGAGLLLLRVSTALVVIMHFVSGLSFGSSAWLPEVVALAGVAGGLLILAGFLTPWAAGWVAGVVMISAFVSPVPESRGSGALVLVTDCSVLALVGPGAWSLDARLFGRRKIVISHSRHKQHGGTTWRFH